MRFLPVPYDMVEREHGGMQRYLREGSCSSMTHALHALRGRYLQG